jgi:hypothetical protein
MRRPIEPPPVPIPPPPPLPSFVRTPPLPLAPFRLNEDTASATSPASRPEAEAAPPPIPLRKGRNELKLIASGIEWIFGFFCLIGGLALLATLPLLQFLSLGYLLEAGGRVTRSGRLREGVFGVRQAARIGGIVLASLLFLFPVKLLGEWVASAHVLDPGGKAEAGWTLGLYFVAVLVFLHITLACACGGRLRFFIPPINVIWFFVILSRGRYYPKARDAVWDFTMGLRLPYYFWLGLRGAGVAMAWLFLPVSLLILGHSRLPGAVAEGILGGLFFTFVLLYLPFLQLRMVAYNRFAEGFNLFAVRRDFRKAPWAFALSVVVTLLFALPLYLFKIEIVPSEAASLPGLIFIAFIYPARLLTGWAMGRANRRQEPRHWFFRWTGRVPLVPVAGFYVMIVFFTQYTSWNGVWSLYEQHEFLVPVPFFGL